MLSGAGYYNYAYMINGVFDPTAVGSDDLSRYLVESSSPKTGFDLPKDASISLNLIPNPDNPPTPKPTPTAVAFPSLGSAVVQSASPAPVPSTTFTPPKPKQSQVKYIVEADGPIGLITYTNFIGNKMGQEQATEEVWGLVEKAYEFASSDFETRYGIWSLGVSAQAGAGTASVTCRIMLDGREISKQTSTGPYALVICNAGG